MLVNLNKKTVFAHIPKTGGASISEVLLKRGFVRYGDPHVNRLKDFPYFLKVCMVRNPYEIVASYYIHKFESGATYNFEFFVDNLFKMRSGPKVISQHKYSLDCNIVMRYERYDADFKSFCNFLNIKYEKPGKIHKFKEYTWRDFYYPKVAGMVYEIAHTDFKVLEYDSNSWKGG